MLSAIETLLFFSHLHVTVCDLWGHVTSQVKMVPLFSEGGGDGMFLRVIKGKNLSTILDSKQLSNYGRDSSRKLHWMRFYENYSLCASHIQWKCLQIALLLCRNVKIMAFILHGNAADVIVFAAQENTKSLPLLVAGNAVHVPPMV